MNRIWRDAKLRGVGLKRARTLVTAAEHSIGSREAQEAARRSPGYRSVRLRHPAGSSPPGQSPGRSTPLSPAAGRGNTGNGKGRRPAGTRKPLQAKWIPRKKTRARGHPPARQPDSDRRRSPSPGPAPTAAAAPSLPGHPPPCVRRGDFRDSTAPSVQRSFPSCKSADSPEKKPARFPSSSPPLRDSGYTAL